MPNNAPYADPYEFFADCFRAASEANLPQHDSMVLCTSTPEGRPSARLVLLKGVIPGRGFLFFTNYDSRKAAELRANPHAALVFYWPQQGRQIRVEGAVRTLAAKESDEYWFTRPRDSRIGAIASKQSRLLDSMETLRREVARVEQEFDGKEVARPENWGGFEIAPERIEFWYDGANRLHERFVYTRAGDGWSVGMLYP